MQCKMFENVKYTCGQINVLRPIWTGLKTCVQLCDAVIKYYTVR